MYDKTNIPIQKDSLKEPMINNVSIIGKYFMFGFDIKKTAHQFGRFTYCK